MVLKADPEGAGNRVTLCSLLVFVNEATEPIKPGDHGAVADRPRFICSLTRVGCRYGTPKTATGPWGPPTAAVLARCGGRVRSGPARPALDGLLAPVITAAHPFSDAPAALATVENGHTSGKVVIKVA